MRGLSGDWTKSDKHARVCRPRFRRSAAVRYAIAGVEARASTSRPSTALHSYAAVSSFIRSFRRTDSVKHINRRGGGAASGSDSNAINAGIACTADAGLLGGAGPIISTWQGQMSQASF